MLRSPAKKKTHQFNPAEGEVCGTRNKKYIEQSEMYRRSEEENSNSSIQHACNSKAWNIYKRVYREGAAESASYRRSD